MNEIALVDNTTERNHQIIISQRDVEALNNTRKLIADYVKANLVRDQDYGIIPGCDKDSLYKPGAQKLRMLFGLGIKIEIVKDNTLIERENNFCMFTYRASVFNLRNDVVIASCEGSCNSQEKKYRERSEWREVNGKKVKVTVPAQAFDQLNTIMKMAQKRAIVGATIEATGVSDYFTQDLEDDIVEEIEKPKATEFPTCCGKKMMVSKFNQNELYCPECKKKVTRF